MDYPVIPGDVWEIEGSLGEGGMGRVYAAKHRATLARAAIKVLVVNHLERPDFAARFRQEAFASNKVDDSGVVRVFDSGELENGAPYLVMEYLDGKTLHDVLHKVTPSADKLRQVVRFAHQIAATMAVVHEREVIHRDLKPSNVMVLADRLAPGGSRIKILDFGIAKVLSLPASESFDEDGYLEHTSVVGLVVTEPGPTDIGPGKAATTAPSASDTRRTEVDTTNAGRTEIDADDGRTEIDADDGRTEIDSDDERSNDVDPVDSEPAGLPDQLPAGAVPPTVAASPLNRPASSGRKRPRIYKTDRHARSWGTPPYQAPEQKKNMESVTGKADVYSLGVMLYEFLHKRPDRKWPAPGDPWPPVLPKIESHLSPKIEVLLESMLKRSPDHRPTMKQVEETLLRIWRTNPEFEAALAEWDHGKRNARFLPRGEVLHRWQAWAKDLTDRTEDEDTFLSQAAAAESKRKDRILIGLIAGIIILTCSLLATGYSWRQAVLAKREAVLAKIQAEAAIARETTALKNAALADEKTRVATNAEEDYKQAAATSDAKKLAAQAAQAKALEASAHAKELADKFGHDAANAKEARDKATELSKKSESAEREATAAAATATAAQRAAEQSALVAEAARAKAVAEKKLAEQNLSASAIEFKRTVDELNAKLTAAEKRTKDEADRRQAAELRISHDLDPQLKELNDKLKACLISPPAGGGAAGATPGGTTPGGGATTGGAATGGATTGGATPGRDIVDD